MASHQPPETRRAQILGAALACFAEHGYHGARMDDIARAAGLSKGAVYHHFSNKEDIYNALFDDYAASFASMLATANQNDLAATLQGYGLTVIHAIASERRMARAWVEFFAHAGARDRLAETYADARRELTRLLKAHGIGGAKHWAAVLIATIEGLVLQAVVDPSFDPAKTWRQTNAGLVSAMTIGGSPAG